ncbi:cysteine desulfurase family protein [Microbacterium sp. SORGH_AS_0862]|uniref:cysteine desulfurase family protein n=1 Tax=Microbacterium sp. SORGH_AS_0862 TaxID=3041789 RepID=UPI00278E05D8|nr:aminotransferase class V-fold PLP-dependent enzyme [Microbacterium sp. SORGH_AS_0862]MDQ1206790.1 cysteine desulfurase [Microbacterium sp. SORGH_AS_0862]
MHIYLDHAASSPLRPEAREAWLDAAATTGNASSVHGGGQAARRVLEDARERLAAVVGADPIEVVFTSGGTESVNLAVKGLWATRADGAEAVVLPDGEHHATIDSVAALVDAQHAEVRPVRLSPLGEVDLEGFASALGGAAFATALVANNEVGTLSDAAGLAARAASALVPLHLDAVAAFGQVPVDFRRWRGDVPAGVGLVALSLSAHKVGGPVGTGALVSARSARIGAQMHGGAQQRGLRAGTQDIAGAAAFAVAAELAAAERDAEAVRLAELRDRLVSRARALVPGLELLGDPVRRIPGNAHLLVPGALGETLLFLLDTRGISVSTGSACQAGIAEPSHVVRALGRDEEAARSVLRITLGRTTTPDDVDAFLEALPWAAERARAAGARTVSSS